MDILNEIVADWKKVTESDSTDIIFTNQKNINLMETFIAIEQKEREAKGMVKKICLSLALFLTVILGFYALLNYFEATTISYDLAALILGSIIVVSSIAYIYYSIKVKDHDSYSSLATKEFIETYKSDLHTKRRRTIISFCVLGLIYPLGFALLVSGIFHTSIKYPYLGFLIFIIIVIIFSWITHEREHKCLLKELDALQASIVV